MLISKPIEGVKRNCYNCKFSTDVIAILICLHKNARNSGTWTKIDNVCKQHKYDSKIKAKSTRSIRRVRKL